MIITQGGSSSEDEEDEEDWQTVAPLLPAVNPTAASSPTQATIQIQINKPKQQEPVEKKTRKKSIKKRDRIIRAFTHFSHLLYSLYRFPLSLKP